MPKLLTLLPLILLTYASNGQSTPTTVELHVTTEVEPTLLIFSSTDTVTALPSFGGTFTFKDLDTGYYYVTQSVPGRKRKTTDSVYVQKGQQLRIQVTRGRCLYDHPAGWEPVCPENHTDNILPIVYGLILEKKNSRNKYREGGCIVTFCDPKYYCKTHDIEF